MKKQIYKIWFLSLLVGGAFLYSCTDDFEETNTNPNKFYTTDFKYVLPGSVYKTINVISDLNYNYLLNYSRLVTVQVRTVPSENLSDTYYRQVYSDILRDLESVETDYTGKEGHKNRLAMIKTWKAYAYYILVSLYGPVPMSDAILSIEEKKSTFKYDSELQVYTQILDLLEEASNLYQSNSLYTKDILAPDFLFNLENGSISKWQKFTNTLRLDIAMHVQNLSPELAQKHATAAMSDENLLISSNADNVAPRFGTDKTYDVSYYYENLLKKIDSNGTWNAYEYPSLSEYYALYLFSYKDPRIEAHFMKSNEETPNTNPFLFTDTITRVHICSSAPGVNNCPNYAAHQADGLNAFRRDSILVDYSVPYVPITESQRLPVNWEADYIPGTASGSRYSDPLRTNDKLNVSRVKMDYLKPDATVVLLNYATTCFLKAEAKIKFGLGAKSAQSYYEDGVKASFEQCQMTGKAADYLKQPGIAWNTNGKGYYDKMGFYCADINGAGSDENHLEQIYKQRAFGCFFNGLEGWNLERRTRAFRYPPVFNSNSSIEGVANSQNYSFGRERMIYPLTELMRNKGEYYTAIDLLQNASPNGNSAARWGDNIVTALAFSKVDPEVELAESKYGGTKRIPYHAHYFCHYWGTTYEQLLDTAQVMTGETNATRALTRAFNYTLVSRYSTYLTITPPTP